MLKDRQELPLTSIVADPDIWPRERLDRDRVDVFHDLYAADGPSALPPLAVVEVATGFLLADGWHRLAALQELDSPTARVELLDAGGRDGRSAAYEEGLRSCAAAAKPLTRTERRAAILRLTVAGGRTDREIGRLVGVSHQTVARVRAESGGGPLDQEPADEEAIAWATALDLSRRLVRGVRRIWDARGVTDLIANRMPRNLADALVEEFGEAEAVTWARRLAAWSDRALRELGGS